MYKLILLIVAMFYSTSFALSSYKLEVTRNGKTQQKMTFNIWSGEYPQPVIDVNSKVQGTTQIQAYKSVRDLTERPVCTIKNGIYHPWSSTNTKNGTIYYSIKAQEDYQARRKTTLESFVFDPQNPAGKKETYHFEPGDLLQNIYYASEGTCIGTQTQIVKKQKISAEISFACEALDNKNIFKRLTPQSVKDDNLEQWLYLSCEEGYKAFIRDMELLNTPSVKEGTIVEYGVVGPAQ